MSYEVVYAPEAEAQLVALYRYIARAASAEIADRFTSEIVDQCEALDRFPLRGAPRDDLRAGLRTLAFRRRVTIAYSVDPKIVTIIALFYAGQDFEGLLNEK